MDVTKRVGRRNCPSTFPFQNIYSLKFKVDIAKAITPPYSLITFYNQLHHHNTIEIN
jgi:hypothetical protein